MVDEIANLAISSPIGSSRAAKPRGVTTLQSRVSQSTLTSQLSAERRSREAYVTLYHKGTWLCLLLSINTQQPTWCVYIHMKILSIIHSSSCACHNDPNTTSEYQSTQQSTPSRRMSHVLPAGIISCHHLMTQLATQYQTNQPTINWRHQEYFIFYCPVGNNQLIFP